MTSLLLENLMALPGNLVQDATYILGNGVLQAAYSGLSRAFPTENDGSTGDQIRLALMEGFQNTADLVYDAERGCRIPDGETAPQSFMRMLGRIWTSAPYIPVFALVDWGARAVVGDNGSIESIYEATTDPNHTLKVAASQGAAWWIRFAAWNGYSRTEAFHSMDSRNDEAEKSLLRPLIPSSMMGRAY
jgi:hypothetical protein